MEAKSLKSEVEFILASRGEDYPVAVLDKINIKGISLLNSIFNEIKDRVEGVKNYKLNSAWILCVGDYGTGKTILLRYIAHHLVNEEDRVIPIYFLLSIPDHVMLFTRIRNLVDEVEKYKSNPEFTTPTLYGTSEGWEKGNKLTVLKEAIKEVEEKQQKISEFEKFKEVMRTLNIKKYVPVLIFDEFERLTYTGEGLITDEAYLTFKDVVTNFLALTRGHFFNGVGIIASTDSLDDLFKKAVERESAHIRKLAEILRIEITTSNLEKLVDRIQIISPNIAYSSKIEFNWNYERLKEFNNVYKLGIPDNIVLLLSKILPTPRALLELYNKLKYRQIISQEEVHKIVYEVIKDRLNDLLSELASTLVENKPILYSKAKWDIYLRKLCENGYYVIKWEEMENIANTLKLEGKSQKISAKERFRNVLNKLEELGLYNKIEKGTYALNKYIFAYLIGIERLPSGESTSLENIIKIISENVRKIREKRKARQKKVAPKKEAQATIQLKSDKK
jgi:Cdc6-like AAA superfamily ATPase